MTEVVNEIRINGPIEQVFDIVTTARHWPRWHPATLGVDGVTERPIALGDVIRERARIGGREYEGDWMVAEHVRPERVVLRLANGRLRITYGFRAEGQGTTFRRALEFQPEHFVGSAVDAEALERLMHSQSEEALRRLKPRVEELLAV